jgi:hypothetical protein
MAHNADDIHVEALLQYFNAFEAYPRRAFAYLSGAWNFEEKLIPGSSPAYDYEEGRLFDNRELLTRALTEFDPLWERDMIVKAYVTLATSGKKAERQDAAERLFALNRGAMLQNGIKLPVTLRATERYTEGVLKKAAKAAGIESAAGTTPRYTLSIGSDGDGSISCELYDTVRGITVFRQNLPLQSTSRPHRAAFAKALREKIFDAF